MTKLKVVSKALITLGVGEQFSKKEFITTYWGRCDYFVERTFDVAFCNAKKEFPDREFRSKNKMITRIK
jgi:hypothetical protein